MTTAHNSTLRSSAKFTSEAAGTEPVVFLVIRYTGYEVILLGNEQTRSFGDSRTPERAPSNHSNRRLSVTSGLAYRYIHMGFKFNVSFMQGAAQGFNLSTSVCLRGPANRSVGSVGNATTPLAVPKSSSEFLVTRTSLLSGTTTKLGQDACTAPSCGVIHLPINRRTGVNRQSTCPIQARCSIIETVTRNLFLGALAWPLL